MSIIIEIKVIARSSRRLLMVDKDGRLRCYVRSVPEKGKANKEVVAVVAKSLDVSKSQIEIVSGFSSNKKLIKIYEDLTLQQILQILNSGIQKKIF